jgi:hypothetical protein
VIRIPTRRQLRPGAIAVIAGVLGAAAAASTLPPAATATLVKGMPIEITTMGDRDAARSFALTYWPRGSASVVHRGAAVRTVASRAARADSRQLDGTEVLAGPRGTLVLSWSGTQTRTSKGGWGTATGRWRLVGRTGAYAGRYGRGTFTSDAAFGAVEYRGLLITAQ